jgi:AcrR family transcriptional regulator
MRVGNALAKDEELRDRILEATRRCLSRYSAAKTGIADVASEAGVSRQSVYNHFETRSNLFTLALEKAGDEFAERVASHLASHKGTPLELVVEAILYTAQALPQDPVLRAVASLERDESGGPLLDFSRSLTRDFSRRALAPVQARCKRATRQDFDVLADLMLRITLSLFVLPLPEGLTEKKVRSTLSRWLTTVEWVK